MYINLHGCKKRVKTWVHELICLFKMSGTITNNLVSIHAQFSFPDPNVMDEFSRMSI